jgi:3-phytase
MRVLILLLASVILFSCHRASEQQAIQASDSTTIARPVFVSDPVKYDSDDPAFWIDVNDPAKSLVIGTDKGGDSGDGALFVFDLQGKIQEDKTIRNIKRPNNVDVAYNFQLGNSSTDIAVCTERNTNSIRVFKLPDMQPIDGGGLPVFINDSSRLPMGIALYTSSDKKIYAFVTRKSGPDGTYIHQYLLDGSSGNAKAKLVRQFGHYSGKNEIEAIAVDNELGYVYYSDEGAGIRKYYAHPDSSNQELAFFGTTGFTDNHEGISLYKNSDGTGYIVVSDQQANQFHLFPREGQPGKPHDHPLIETVKTSTIESDGCELTSTPLPGFPNGMFVAMSDDKTFQFYRWEELVKNFK